MGRMEIAVAIGIGVGLGYLSHSWRSNEISKDRGEAILASPGRSEMSEMYATEEDENQEILNLLYLIAEDQTKKTGYIHRGVSCNACGTTPIKGTRYHCTECVDVDLCENCEVAKRHEQFHVLVKIKVPIPIMKSPRWIRKSWRPLECVHANVDFLDSVPRAGMLKLYTDLRFGMDEIAALHNEFKQFVDISIQDKSVSVVGYGITLLTLQKLVCPWNPRCLFATRLAYVYDRDGDGIITFEDFLAVRALARSNEKGFMLSK